MQVKVRKRTPECFFLSQNQVGGLALKFGHHARLNHCECLHFEYALERIMELRCDSAVWRTERAFGGTNKGKHSSEMDVANNAKKVVPMVI